MNEVERYYSELLSAYDNNSLIYRDNTDRIHNAAIMLLMLTKGSSIKMFCGEMSIFRDEFYNEMANTDAPASKHWKEKITAALSDFLSDENRSLEIVVENYSDSMLDDFLLSKGVIDKAPISIFQLPDSIKNKHDILHFSLTGDERIVRLETEKKNHTAICRVGIDTESATSSLANFEKLKSLAIPA